MTYNVFGGTLNLALSIYVFQIGVNQQTVWPSTLLLNAGCCCEISPI